MMLAAADAFIIVIAALMSAVIQMLLQKPISNQMLIGSLAMSVVTCFAGLTFFGAYNRMWRYFNFKDYLSCVLGVTSGIVFTIAFTYLLRGDFARYFSLTHALLSIIGICLFRFIFKSVFIQLVEVGKQQSGLKRTMVIGGGQACRILLGELRESQRAVKDGRPNPALFDPVCILDDDRSLTGSTIEDVPIVGTTHEIRRFIRDLSVDQIIFCIPSCPETDRKRILDSCSETQLPVKIIPFLGNLLFDDGQSHLLGKIRDIKIEDLLGREPVRFDNQDILRFIRGKVCMVTGGGGSIGSELVRQIVRYEPKQVIIVDIYENNAYDIQQELLMDHGDSLHLVTLIASVRDYYRMNQIFTKYHPDIVFHAAAHKHVPLMEDSPMEAIKNNVIGTFHTATLAQFHNVEKFVMISTDKAVNPTNVMGASKRCCEMVVQYLAQQPGCRTEFVTTRFGNVLGSNGSVIPKFKRQIEQGKPVTVTHPDVTRYFMTIPEAVNLVMEAAAIAQGGEIFVLDMGQPVRIVSLAENLIRMYGKEPYKDVPIVFTGLRPGEKIKEELLMSEEGLQKTQNKLIFIGKQLDIEPEQFIADLRMLRDAAEENNEAAAVMALHRMVPTFVTPEEYNRQYLASDQKDT